MNVRLTGLFTLRSPLSHIGESISTVSYLVQEPILQPDGDLQEVFCYSGNAWRGHLRDLSATYMLEALGSPRLGVDTFHLLFSGGRIGGDQVVDVARARAWRQAIPMLALFGGGVGNQLLPGKLRVSNAYPLCAEALPAIPPQHRDTAATRSYRGMTFEKSFSRKDDAKDDRVRGYLAEATPRGQQTLLGDGMSDASPKKKGAGVKPVADGAADQMRMTVELVAAGVQLATEIDLLDASEVELGALVAALHLFSRSPYIGGQSNRGHGLVSLTYEILDLDTGEVQPLLAIDGGPALLAPRAAAAKRTYDTYLREQYDALLAAQGSEIKALLGVSA